MTETTAAAPTWRDRALAALSERFAPFAALLDSRYIPLLLLAAPQAYTVYQWLWLDSDKTLVAAIFAGVGAAAFEAAYVGSVAWAEQGTNDRQKYWIIGTAAIALIFSILVAVRVHWAAQGYWAFLHAGFPLVACLYTVTVHTATKRDATAPLVMGQLRTDLEAAIATLTEQLTQLAQTVATNYQAQGQATTALTTQLATLSTSLEELKASLAVPTPTHVCTDCGAGFGSASALGGHRSRCPTRNQPSLNGHGANHV